MDPEYYRFGRVVKARVSRSLGEIRMGSNPIVCKEKRERETKKRMSEC